MYFQGKTLASEDLKKIHIKYLEINYDFPAYSTRRKYFLAVCKFFHESESEEEFNVDYVVKLRPFGGLIGMDNSTLDTHLKKYKVLRLHAIIHDAAGFMFEQYGVGPGYSYMLPCQLKSCLAGQISGIFFCWFIKMFKSNLYHLLKC